MSPQICCIIKWLAMDLLDTQTTTIFTLNTKYEILNQVMNTFLKSIKSLNIILRGNE